TLKVEVTKYPTQGRVSDVLWIGLHCGCVPAAAHAPPTSPCRYVRNVQWILWQQRTEVPDFPSRSWAPPAPAHKPLRNTSPDVPASGTSPAEPHVLPALAVIVVPREFVEGSCWRECSTRGGGLGAGGRPRLLSNSPPSHSSSSSPAETHRSLPLASLLNTRTAKRRVMGRPGSAGAGICVAAPRSCKARALQCRTRRGWHSFSIANSVYRARGTDFSLPGWKVECRKEFVKVAGDTDAQPCYSCHPLLMEVCAAQLEVQKCNFGFKSFLIMF
ncbi:hypothetical protein C7M84_013463, partial [Penaeus vannamei]